MALRHTLGLSLGLSRRAALVTPKWTAASMTRTAIKALAAGTAAALHTSVPSRQPWRAAAEEPVREDALSSLVGAIPPPPTAVNTPAAEVAAEDARVPWRKYTVGQLLREKAGHGSVPTADRELLQRAGIAVMRESDTVARAAELMMAVGVGSVLVNQGPVLAGIVTLADILRKVLLPRREPHETVLRDIMSSNVICATEAYTIDQCMATLERGQFRHVPVYRDLSGGAESTQNFDEDPRLVGLVSLTDVTFFVAKYLRDHPAIGSTPVRGLLPDLPFKREQVQADEGATCGDAMKKLIQAGRGVVVVTHGADAEPAAMLSERHILRHAMTAGPYYRDALVGAIATDPLPIVTPEVSVADLARLQAEHRFNQVPIVEQVIGGAFGGGSPYTQS